MGRIPNIPWLSCCWSRSFYSSSRSCGIFHDASQNLSRTRVLTTQIFFKSNIFCLQKYEAWLSLADILYHPTVALIATMMTTVQQMQSCVYFDIIFISERHAWHRKLNCSIFITFYHSFSVFQSIILMCGATIQVVKRTIGSIPQINQNKKNICRGILQQNYKTHRLYWSLVLTTGRYQLITTILQKYIA